MKKVLSVLLVVALFITMLPVAAFASNDVSTTGNTPAFSDMPDNWSTNALENALENGLLTGYDGKIMPDEYLTRAQMAAITSRAFGAAGMASLTGYSDVPTEAWYYNDMAKAVQMGVFMGDNGKLNPESSITRQEAFVVLARAIKLADGNAASLNGFSDKGSVASWALGAVSALKEAGYMSGSGNRINPLSNITRAEFAQLMDNLLKGYFKAAGTYTSVPDGNIIINVPDVTLKNVTITGDLIIGDGVGDGNVTLDNVIVTGRTVIRGGGVNSIKITGNSSLQNIIIARVDGKVRVFAEDGTEIGEVIIDGKDDVIIEGGFGTVTIESDGVVVTATNAEINSAVINGDSSKVIVSKNSTIGKLTANAPNAEIEVAGKITDVVINGEGASVSGSGTVTNVNANADNVSVTTLNTAVTAAAGTTGVTAGSKTVDAGNTVNTGSGSSGGSSGSSSKIFVTAINVTGANNATTVTNGGTLQMSATVAPTNATNQTITWSVTNGTGSATIDSNGLLTATSVGTITVTATANDGSGKTGTLVVTVNALISGITAANRSASLEAGQPVQENDGKFDATIAAGAAANEYDVTFTVTDVLESVTGGAPVEGKWMGVSLKLAGISDIADVQYSADGIDWTALAQDDTILAANRANSFMFYVNADAAPTTRYLKDANGTVYTLVFDVAYDALISDIAAANRSASLEAGQPVQENDGKFDATIAAGAAANEYDVTFTVTDVLESVTGGAPVEGKWMGVSLKLAGISDIADVQYSADGIDWTALAQDDTILAANRANSFMFYVNADAAPTTRYLKDANGTVYTLVFDVAYDALISDIAAANRSASLEAGQPVQENDGKFDATIAAGAAANEYDVTFTVTDVLESVTGGAPVEGKWMGVSLKLAGISDIADVQYSADGIDWTALAQDDTILAVNRANSFMFYVNADAAPTTRYLKDANGTVYTLVFDVAYDALISDIAAANRSASLEAGQPVQENDGKFDATIAAGAAANEYDVTFTVTDVLESVTGGAPVEGKWMGVSLKLAGISDIADVQYSADGIDWTALAQDDTILAVNRANSFMFYVNADAAPTTRYLKDANGTVYTLVFDVAYDALISGITAANRSASLEAGQPVQEK